MIPRLWNTWCGSIRRSLPPSTYLIVAAIVIGLVDAAWFGVRSYFGRGEALDTLLQLRDGLIFFLLMAYAVFRVVAFHPIFLRDYATWLERTPWHHALPLPLGPVHLAWPDLLIAGGLALLLDDPRELMNPNALRISSLSGVLLFVQLHSLAMSLAVWLTGPRAFAYVAAFLLPLSGRLSLWSPAAGVVVLAAGTAAAHVSLSRSWSQFPWPGAAEWMSRVKTGWKSMQQTRNIQGFDDDPMPDRVPPSELGWPFGICSPYVAPLLIPTREKMLLSALFGFWLHTLLAEAPKEVVGGCSVLMLVHGVFILAVARLVSFGSNHSSPITFAGRLLTMRWIIPRYDASIIGPLCILAVPAVTGLPGHFWLEVPLDILTPAVTTLTLWTACLAGPSAGNWKLTAPARLVPGRMNKGRFEELS